MDNKEKLLQLLIEKKGEKGYPIGEPENILSLSSPPYYCAFPNPEIPSFVERHGKEYNEETDNYYREPFVGDISEGKNDPVYNVHSYHTKVPYKAIMQFIEHYTDEGDIVLDGFCGTGMTGIAASKLKRKAIISDLSPIATFISYGFNQTKNLQDFNKELDSVLVELKDECLWLYETDIPEHLKVDQGNSQLSLSGEQTIISDKGFINYVVWSDVLICPYCNESHVFWEVALDSDKGKVKDKYECPHCKAEVTKKECGAEKEIIVDSQLGKNISVSKQVPVYIVYTAKVKDNGKIKAKRLTKKPSQYDLENIKRINASTIPYWYPTAPLPKGYNTEQPIRSHGFTNVHLFYTKRNLWCLAALKDKIERKNNPLLLFLFTSIVNRSTQMNRIHLKNFFFGGGGWNAGYLKGTLYVSSIPVETSIFEQIDSRRKSFTSAFGKLDIKENNTIIETTSATKLSAPSNSIDYIFTDPPFGSNIMYSELNFIWESWLKVATNNTNEAIINKVQNKTVDTYKNLMIDSFKEYCRVLKPKRWITIEFNNSSSAIWNLIQEAILKGGFIISQVSVLDKKQGSFKQVTSANSVKSDLVISAFKPSSKFFDSYREEISDELESLLVAEILTNLPSKPIIERTEKMLYSKMVSFFIQKSYEIRYDAKSFYTLLRNNFIEEDGFWFTSDQINSYIEYKKYAKLNEIEEIKSGGLFLFVTDEKSALVWLHNFLNQPKSFSDVSVAFNQLAEIQDDQVPELRDLLEENFVFEGGLYRRPKSEEEHNQITEKRQKHLWKEFETILIQAQTERKKIKEVRKEALSYGFERCYKNKRFKDILTIASKLHPSILENNGELADFLEAAEIQTEGIA